MASAPCGAGVLGQIERLTAESKRHGKNPMAAGAKRKARSRDAE
jgi:hypothetical protein